MLYCPSEEKSLSFLFGRFSNTRVACFMCKRHKC
jgi:hypothetical protein